MKAEFDIDGNFEVLEIVKRLGYGLDEAALAALEEWQFRPAYRSGRRVAVVADIDVEFRYPQFKVSPQVPGNVRFLGEAARKVIVIDLDLNGGRR